jgi:hypothetical protein
MNITENQIIFGVIVLLILYLLFGRSSESEGMCSVTHAAPTGVYNPRLFQPEIAQEVHDDGFIELNDQVETPYVASSNGSKFGEFDNPLQPVDLSLGYSHCSKNCCSPNQWPLPFSMERDDYLEKNKDKYTGCGSNIMCNNGFSSGCVCLEKKQEAFLNNRGNNSFTGL